MTRCGFPQGPRSMLRSKLAFARCASYGCGAEIEGMG